MTERQEHPKFVELTKKEKLTDEQLGNLISAVGNNAAKAITLLTMRTDNIYSPVDLYRAFLFSQGEEVGWKMHHYGPFQYCENSLAPIGLVTKEALNSDLSTYGYLITNYGEKVGVPLCGLMLDWSKKHNINLNLFWGGTQSRSRPRQLTESLTDEEFEYKKRSPITTLKILLELLTTPNLPIRAIDLTDNLNEPQSSLIGHLQRLATAGVIDYQTVGVNKTYSAYKLVSFPPVIELPIYQGKKSFTKAVFLILQQHPSLYLTIEDIDKLLPQTIKEHSSQRNLRIRTSAILAFLKRNGYLENEKFNSGFKSEINLNDDQRIVLTELLEIIDRLQNQDPEIMARGQRIAAEIINDSNAVSTILRETKEQSNSANKTPISETMDLIRYLISAHPGITNNEILKLLKQEGKNLGNHAIRKLTALLETEGYLETTEEGKIKRFFPKDTPGQPR